MPDACPSQQGFTYERRHPELHPLHKAVRIGWPLLQQEIAEHTAAALPKFVVKGFEAYLTCGQLAAGFCRVKCRTCRQEEVVAWSCKQRGVCASCDGKRRTEEAEHLTKSVLPVVPYRQWVLSMPFDVRYLLGYNAEMRNAVLAALVRAVTRYYVASAKQAGIAGDLHVGAITVIQRFSSDLRLNVHFHTLVADGVWAERDGKVVFEQADPLGELDVQEVLWDAQLRIDRQLKARGWQDRQDDPFADKDPALAALMRASIRGELFDPPEAPPRHSGTKAQLRALPRPDGKNCAVAGGYSLHADRRIAARDREELALMVRYLCRPAVAADRLSELPDGRFELTLKSAYRDGTKTVILSALDLTARLAAVMPLPRTASVRYHGSFAPHAKLRPLVVLAGDKAPTRRKKAKAPTDTAALAAVTQALADLESTKPWEFDREAAEWRASTRLSWAQAMKAAFKKDVLHCDKCGGTKQVIAAIPPGAIASKILRHLGLPTQTVTKAEPCDIWRVRGPPGELVPDLDDWGPELYPDTVDEVYEEDDMRGFFDDEPEPGLAA